MNGGRYDKLLGQFGCDKASIGFSITIDRLIAALNRQNIHIPHDANGTLLVYNADRLGDAINVSKKLRSTGVNVCMIEYKDSKSDSQYIEYAKESSLVNVAFIDDEYASDLMRYITIALAKGRLAKKAMEIFEQIGIPCEEMKDEKTRKLIFTNEELGFRFFLSKPSDVPTYVEYGAADIGIVGKDTILEEGRSLYEVYDLQMGKCRMCVCGPESAREKLQHHELIRVASKYPNIAKDYFNNIKHQTVEIIKLNGSVELAPIVGLAEVIVDIVETGATLRENGLEVLEEVCPLSARMVVNQVSMKMEQERINKLINDVKKYIETQGI